MKRTIFTAIALGATLVLGGCATSASSDYALYAQTQQRIAQAQATSEAARYAALAEIAKNGDPTAKVVAALSLSFTGQNGTGAKPVQINPPTNVSDKVLQWTGVLLPSLTNIYGIAANRQVAITQSNNSAAVAQSTNNTFAAMNAAGHNANTAIANQGFTAVTNVANAGLTATTNVANAGITGVVNTAANGLTAATTISNNSNAAITNVSNAANESIQALTGQLGNLQPNITTNTTNTTIVPPTTP